MRHHHVARTEADGGDAAELKIGCIIDGRESVGFLVRVKELLENPELLLFGKDPVKSLLEL